MLLDMLFVTVSNYTIVASSRFAPIVLYAKDDTEIIRGAEADARQKHLESKDEQKPAKVYKCYKKNGSLLGGVKYINLRDPQDNIPPPI
jgi:hypothetical protein